MIKKTLGTITLLLALPSAVCAATAEEKCQAQKLIALGKRDLCFQRQSAAEVLGRPYRADNSVGISRGKCVLCVRKQPTAETSTTTKCDEIFLRAVRKADEEAATRDTSCRWLEHGDGTATDLDTGLQWELKTDDGSIHDKDYRQSWSRFGSSEADGTAYRSFLGTLNGGPRPNGDSPTGCFANKCDWRLPTVDELRSLLIEPYPCRTDPCTSIPGYTASTYYWSSTTLEDIPREAWHVDFMEGVVNGEVKDCDDRVRAVRNGR